MRGVPILMYHQVAPHPHLAFRKYCVTPRSFRMQMATLARAGYTTIDLDTLLDAREGSAKLPARPVVITFDDGFLDCVEHAVPIMRARGFTATFYVVAGLMGGRSDWLRAERGVDLRLMGWDAARQLESEGFRCGVHTLSHPHLADLAEAECRREIAGAREVLEAELGHAVRHLAYPFGSFNRRVRDIAAESGFRSACTTEIGLSGPKDDPLALHRVPVTGQDSTLDFMVRLRSAWPATEFVRGKGAAVLRRVRVNRR